MMGTFDVCMLVLFQMGLAGGLGLLGGVFHALHHAALREGQKSTIKLKLQQLAASITEALGRWQPEHHHKFVETHTDSTKTSSSAPHATGEKQEDGDTSGSNLTDVQVNQVIIDKATSRAKLSHNTCRDIMIGGLVGIVFWAILSPVGDLNLRKAVPDDVEFTLGPLAGALIAGYIGPHILRSLIELL